MFVGDGRIELKHPGTITKVGEENEREKEKKNQCIRTMIEEIMLLLLT